MLGNQTPNEYKLEAPIVDFDAPPPYEPINEESVCPCTTTVEQPTEASLPTYPDVATNTPPYKSKLPSYEEVQNEKFQNREMSSTLHQQLPPSNPSLNHNVNSERCFNDVSSTPFTFIRIHDTELENLYGSSGNILGTDLMFLAAFIVAFIFNWIGFLILICFCQTIAARYGALSGFGLSLSKWSLIVKSTNLTSEENSWLWWLLVMFGLLICIRTLFQYINIKRTWRILSIPE